MCWNFIRTAVSNKKPHQYLSIEKAVPADNQTFAEKSTTISSSSSVKMSSSASNHDSSEHDDDDSTSGSGDSDSSGSSQSSEHDACSDDLSACEPLTEDALIQHNVTFEPMNSKERIQFWNIADEFSDIEDDFDEQRNFSKPIRSERVSWNKVMFTFGWNFLWNVVKLLLDSWISIWWDCLMVSLKRTWINFAMNVEIGSISDGITGLNG